jgi:hypothetical protein
VIILDVLKHQVPEIYRVLRYTEVVREKDGKKSFFLDLEGRALVVLAEW